MPVHSVKAPLLAKTPKGNTNSPTRKACQMCLAFGALNCAECVKRASDISSSPAVNEPQQYPIRPDSQAVSLGGVYDSLQRRRLRTAPVGRKNSARQPFVSIYWSFAPVLSRSLGVVQPRNRLPELNEAISKGAPRGRRTPRSTAQNRRGITSSDSRIRSAPSFSPYRLQRPVGQSGPADEQELIPTGVPEKNRAQTNVCARFNES
jgi:hypothetical protein